MWRWPIALGLLSASGLLSALVSDGWGDAWSWLALGVPVLVMAWFGLRRPARCAEASDPGGASTPAAAGSAAFLPDSRTPS
ncbi:hypothetical protein OOT46_03325 [Aquabacterium sp. A7-Y]|uniref:hypothetical protein n=1 Tax=Aquabacterium sp. A7-Y TaxID=1349605 RepID=UPI00223D9FC9|nr:hypothetical protein [Aquabacterium sp. A7-Y]MCW7536884.1 hypothetical protein [Aquabacterium sp. A7-Y]